MYILNAQELEPGKYTMVPGAVVVLNDRGEAFPVYSYTVPAGAEKFQVEVPTGNTVSPVVDDMSPPPTLEEDMGPPVPEYFSEPIEDMSAPMPMLV